VGLVPVLGATGEAFDAARHQLPEGQTATNGSTILETIATGYSLQGKVIRLALVQLQGEEKPAATKDAAPSQLSFDTTDATT
jgi:molecular chaperone GrpE (heat shock protein)